MDRFRQFAEKTTIHGIKDFLRIDYLWARCLWGVIFCSCLCVMIFEMHGLMKEYVDDPTATQVRQKSLPRYPYPKMIFCPTEWINETKVAELKIPKPLLVYGLSLLMRIQLDPNETREAAPKVDRLNVEFDRFLENNGIPSYLDFFLTIADDQAVVSRCDQCEVHRNQVLASGVCIQWRAVAATSDLLIQLPPSFSYTKEKAKTSRKTSVPSYVGSFVSDAMYVSFRPQYDFFAYDPILLNRNNSYVLRIKPTNYVRLDKPDRPCATEEKVKGDAYSQLMCYFRCDERYKAKCLGCRYLSHDRNKWLTQSGSNSTTLDQKPLLDTELPFCTSLTLNEARNGTCVGAGDEEFVECAKSCQPLCNEWVYETTVIPVAGRNLITANEGADITCVLSYQVRFGETFIQEVQTYSWQTFVSNIGGQLGLWIGASVISLLQLFQFLAEFCYYDLYVGRRGPKTSGAGNESRTHVPSSLISAVYTTGALGAQNWSFQSAFEQGALQQGGQRRSAAEADKSNGHGWHYAASEAQYY